MRAKIILFHLGGAGLFISSSSSSRVALCLYNVELDEKITDAPVTLFVNALCTLLL
jgi:hypothetical protein